jgi:hypothetical protein
MPDIDTTMNTLRDDYFKAVNKPISSVYLDLEMISDLRLGALISTFTVPKQMEYLYSRMPEYNARYDLKTAKYFPVLGKTDEELDDIIRNQPDKVARLAPWTVVLQKFAASLSVLEMNNRNINPDLPLSVTVNCQEIEYPKDLQEVFIQQLKGGLQNLEVTFTHHKRYEESPAYYLGFDLFFLYDYAAYLRDERLAESFTSRYTYMDKIMYVLPLVDEETKLDKSEYMKALRSTKNHLDLFTDFYYMTGGIPIDTN